MKLIADSGSTKTDWRLIGSQGKIIQYESPGLNPYFWSDAKLGEEIAKMAEFFGSSSIREVYFYGSGLGDPHQKSRISNALEGRFSKLQILEVHHDLLAAARASCGHSKGVACILGTGANACFFDGSKILNEAVSLGYILGDEGSGAWFGKQLLSTFLRNELSPELHKAFQSAYPVQREEVLMKVYRGDQPNKFLAQFSPFLQLHKNHPQIYLLLKNGFELFLQKHVKPFEAGSEVPVNFVGSIAYHFQDVIQRVVTEQGWKSGRILQSPIAGLTLYHQD